MSLPSIQHRLLATSRQSETDLQVWGCVALQRVQHRVYRVFSQCSRVIVAFFPVPLGCMEGLCMFTFVLLAEIGLRATHIVDFQAHLRPHLRQLYTL